MLSSEFWQTTSAEEVFESIVGPENRRFVLGVMDQLEFDDLYSKQVISMVSEGGVEIRGTVSWLASQLKPSNYLEIGVRRGFSMAMVAAREPTTSLYGFDLWVRNYAGVPNPGPKLVKSELAKLGHTGETAFFAGDSHRTVPAFFHDPKARLLHRWRMRLPGITRPSEFDLITVDGEHSILGAYDDLRNVMPHCTIGGAVVFDDINPDLEAIGEAGRRGFDAELGSDPRGWQSLHGVWHAISRDFPNFRYFEFIHTHPGVAFAVRLS